MERFSIRRGLAVAAFVAVAVIGSIGAASFRSNATGGTSMIAGSAIRFIGPFYSTQLSFDSTNGGQVGGEVRIYLATDTLRIGDVAVYTGNNTVNKSSTGSAHEKVMGVVVGGRSTSMDCSLLSADVGTIAALPGRPVVLLRRGRTYVRVDTVTATDTVHAGDRIKPSTGIAGRVKPATSSITATISTADTTKTVKGASVSGPITVAGDGFNKILGTGVKLTVPGGLLLADINVR